MNFINILIGVYIILLKYIIFFFVSCIWDKDYFNVILLFENRGKFRMLLKFVLLLNWLLWFGVS